MVVAGVRSDAVAGRMRGMAVMGLRGV